MPRVDDLLVGLVDKLGKVSPAWTEAFPPEPRGYRALNRLITRHGYAAVKEALQFALEEQIKPVNPMAVLIGLCRGREKVEAVDPQRGLL